MQYKTSTEQQTIKLGEKFAKGLRGGELLILSGDLGSGKTVFTKGLAKGLGIKKVITSPTFVLFKAYPLSAPPAGRRLPLGRGRHIKYFVHADCYRLKNGHDIIHAGLSEYLGRKDTVVVVEWGERLAGHLQKRYNLIKFKPEGKGRLIKIIKK